MGQVIVVIGMQRSGNHGVMNWISGLFDQVHHFNNQRHDVLTDPDFIAALEALDGVALVSFEDTLGKSDGAADALIDSVVIAQDSALLADALRVHVFRSPYNLWASRLAGHRKGGLSSSPRWEDFRANWLGFARAYHQEPEAFILYDRWVADQSYRQEIAARLGGVFSDAGLAQVTGQGGGSSFEGKPRKSYASLLTNPGVLFSPQSWARLLQRPGHYIRRWTQPPFDASALKTDERFKHLPEFADGMRVLEDDEVAVEAKAIFGLERPDVTA